VDADGHTIVAVSHPGDGKVIKPVVRARSAGLSGDFSLTVFEFTVGDLGTGAAEKVAVVSDYRDRIPSDPSIVIDNDIDGDGVYNLLDPDIDGDGVPNEIDPDPYDPNVYNLPPTGAQAITMASEVKEGEIISLSATATDPNDDPLTYTWTVDRIPSWTRSGQEIDVLASGDFKPGDFIFTVTVSDGKSTETATDSVEVTIIKDGDSNPLPIWLIVLIIGISVIAIIILVYFFVIKGKDDEEPMEIEPDPAYGGSGIEDPSGVPEMDEEDDMIIDSDIPTSSEQPTMSDDMSMEEDEGEEDVQELEQLIVDLEKTEEDIQDLCPECGASLGPMDEVCPNCGSEFELALECPNCSTVVEEGLESCPKCGVLFK
ncbi:MAG: zinc ribbon domain-containing protein, partial [Candidatus Thermoplasmatota archaeon]|nr:zinc ribbon domain-containing protein [Candidatus Thermoplasmatota archaeon]